MIETKTTHILRITTVHSSYDTTHDLIVICNIARTIVLSTFLLLRFDSFFGTEGRHFNLSGLDLMSLIYRFLSKNVDAWAS